MATLGPKDRAVIGDYNALCDVCGFKYKASELRRRWDGAMVCDSDYEERHPLDRIRVPKPESSPRWTRPEPEPTFITPAPADWSKL